ncbi:MAG TPA: DinB family protein, partial [Gemmatimonadales bacterium]|nr:DinB family protein [Gemmatimonadales bacterium]
MSTSNPLIALLLRVIDQAYDQKSWHGTTLRGSLRGLTAEEALWRPGRGRHNIWELALHAAYWKYAVRRRLAGEEIGTFERKPSNWPEIPAPSDARAWKRDVAFLDAEHRKLRAVIADLTPA